MKQKVVLKVAMNCEKCRSEALKVAAGQPGEAKLCQPPPLTTALKIKHSLGVDSVALDGKEKEKVVVIGDFDAVKLTENLRKKVGATEILTLGKQN